MILIQFLVPPLEDPDKVGGLTPSSGADAPKSDLLSFEGDGQLSGEGGILRGADSLPQESTKNTERENGFFEPRISRNCTDKRGKLRQELC